MISYQEARDFFENISSSGIVLGTEPMLNLLKRVGNPQEQLKFVHIAGTNGKGSTLAFISTIMTEAGYKVGRYSSPRVYEYEEFVQIDGNNITKEDFCKFTEPVKKAIEEIEAAGEPVPTVFEAETALGMLYFANKKCDLVIIECGLGGRDDATNVLDHVVCNVITSIGLDHTKFLGDTLAKIADVKAGIIRDNAPVVLSHQDEEVLNVVREHCKKMNAPLTITKPEEIVEHTKMETSSDGRVMMAFDYGKLKDIKVGLLGRYQLKNASTAIEVVKILNQTGYPITDEQMKKGLMKTVWKGRFETIATHPQVVVDGAHNPHGVVQLKESVQYYFKGKRIIAIMGVLADKNFDKEAKMMAPYFEKVYTVTPPNNPRALEASKLAQCVSKYHSDVTPCDSLKEAVKNAYHVANKEDVILIFGSLSYLGAIMREVEEYNKNMQRKDLDLTQIRKEIDVVDRELATLFMKRMKLAGDVAEYKIGTGKPVRDVKRETEKLNKLVKIADTRFNGDGIREMFTQIMAVSRKYQYHLMNKCNLGAHFPFEQVDHLKEKNSRVVYQGVEGAYAHEAVLKYFGKESPSFHVETWEEAMNALVGGRADFAVLPIENSTAGVVAKVYDLLAKYDNYIVDEVRVPVAHALLGLHEATIDDINIVYSHPQAIAQCSRFLDEQRSIKASEVYNTAVAAKKVKEDGLINQAAIASSAAGEIYGLKVLKQPLNHDFANATRFVIISNRKVFKANANKISICFEVAHETGSLYSLLSHIIFNSLNMTRIESRPVPGQTWEYRFFVDFEGNLNSSGVKNALTGISEEAVSFKILGNY